MKETVRVMQLNNVSGLAKTLSNSTAQEIITFIKLHKGCTATDIKKGLKLPASTVHYNLKALTKTGIVDDSNFHYSTKGKEVSHYQLKSNIIVILPETKKDEKTITKRLQRILPGLLGVVGVIGLGYIVNLIQTSSSADRGYQAYKMLDLAQPSISADIQTVTSPKTTAPINQVTMCNSQQVVFILTGIIIGIILTITIIYFIRWLRKRKKTIRK